MSLRWSNQMLTALKAYSGPRQQACCCDIGQIPVKAVSKSSISKQGMFTKTELNQKYVAHGE